MYFWKTRLLAEDLKQNRLGEDKFKSYYLATSALNVACMYLAMLVSRDNMQVLVVEALAVLSATVFGIHTAFNANGGSRGNRFIEKVVSLSFPLLIKNLLASVVFGGAIGLAVLAGVERNYAEWANAISVAVIQIVFFWRLTTHMRYVNT